MPQDVSLIGYDNVRNARYFTPALTTRHCAFLQRRNVFC
ncbi:hypothetical protein [Escherichia coli]